MYSDRSRHAYVHQNYKYYVIYFDIHIRVGDNLNIKVADFGLARDVYIKEYYRQQSTGKIPVRWMAPEALHDKISNEKTDVVSQLTAYHIAR